MDGRRKRIKSFFKLAPVAAVLGIAVGGLLPSGSVFGQAMGQAAIDPPAPSPAAVTSPPVVPAPVLAAATTNPAPTVQKPVATVAPVVEIPENKAASPAAAIAEAKPLPTLLPETKPEVKPDAAPRATPDIKDSMPAEAAKSAVLAIEKKAIRGNSAETASQESKGGTAGGTGGGKSATSYVPPGLAGILQVVAALTAVIGLIFVGKALAKKFVPGAKAGNGKGVIEILARYPLSKNQSLVLVRIGSQIVTLNQGKEQSHSVLVINEPTEVAKIIGQIEGTNPKSIQAGFSNLLANARMDLEKTADDGEDFEARSMKPENLDNQLEEMAAAKRQLMQLRQQVRSVRDSLPQ